MISLRASGEKGRWFVGENRFFRPDSFFDDVDDGLKAWI